MNQRTIMNAFYFLCALTLSIYFISLAQHCYFSDSEIWLLTLSNKMFEVTDSAVIYYKWLFHIIVYLMSHWAPTEVDVFLWARFGCSLLAITSTLITTSIFVQVFNRRYLFFPLFIFIFACSLYFNQGFRIRADLISYFFHVISVWYLLYVHKLEKIKLRHHLIALVLNTLLLTTGAKVIYFFIAQFILALMLATGRDEQKNSQKSRDFMWLVCQSHLIGVILVTFGCFITFFISSVPNLPFTLSLAIEFFFKKFQASTVTPPYFHPVSWWYVKNFILRNFIHDFAIVFMLFYLILHKAMPKRFPLKLTELQEKLAVYAFILFFFAMGHNDKLPFFLAPMLLPFFALVFMFGMEVVENLKEWVRLRRLILFSIVTICTYNALHQYYYNILLNTNIYQKNAIKQFEKYTADNPDMKFYDMVGLNPRKTQIFAFIGPAEEENKEHVLKLIRAHNPDIVVYVYKLTLLEPDVTDIMKTYMIPVDKDIWVRGRILSEEKTPQLFHGKKTINGTTYWLIDPILEKYIYDLNTGTVISPHLMALDKDFKQVDRINAKYLALPMAYTLIGASNFLPVNFLLPASALFRYDIGF